MLTFEAVQLATSASFSKIAGVWAGMFGTGLRVIIRLELGQLGSLIGEEVIILLLTELILVSWIEELYIIKV